VVLACGYQLSKARQLPAGRALPGDPVSSIGVLAASVGGIESLREGLVRPLIADGHEVAVTLTPTAAVWLEDLGMRTVGGPYGIASAVNAAATARAEIAPEVRRIRQRLECQQPSEARPRNRRQSSFDCALCECVATVPMRWAADHRGSSVACG
jgi:hypothetical protein